MPGMHAAGDDAVPKGIRRDDASAARPKKKSSADEDDEGIEEIDGGGVPLSPMAEEDEGSWGDEGAPDVMMTFDGENWVPRRSSFDASSI